MRVAELAGWTLDRVAGDHFQFTRPGVPVVVSIPNHRELSPGTLRVVIRKLGLTVDEFIRLRDS